jgi:FlaA1/EpsC-like NDP-sugar epimerase
MSVCVVVGERMAEMLASNSGQRQMAAEEKTMKVLVIGATGKLGSELVKVLL